jgi:hypothetical protein
VGVYRVLILRVVVELRVLRVQHLLRVVRELMGIVNFAVAVAVEAVVEMLRVRVLMEEREVLVGEVEVEVVALRHQVTQRVMVVRVVEER